MSTTSPVRHRSRVTDPKAIEEALRRAGWTTRPSKHGNVAFPADPTFAPIAWGGTPQDRRAIANAAAALRRAGLPL